MNLNKANGLGLDISTYVIKNNLNLSARQRAALLYNHLSTYQKLSVSATDKTIRNLNGDISKENTETEISLENNGVRVSHKFKTLSKEEKARKKAYQDEYIRKYCEVSGETQFNENAFVEKYENVKNCGQRRNIGVLFGGYIKPDDPNLDPEKVFETLNSHIRNYDEEKLKTGITPKMSDEDLNLLNSYIRGCADKLCKTIKIPKNDQEVLDSAGDFYRLGMFMSPDGYKNDLELLFHCEVPKEFDDNFKKMKNALQPYWAQSAITFNTITDPLYGVVDSYTQEKISEIVSKNDYYDTKCKGENEKVNFSLPFGNIQVSDSVPFENINLAKEYFYQIPEELARQDNENFVKWERKIENGDIILDIDGNQIEQNEMRNHLYDGMVTVIKKDGSGIQTIATNEDGLPSYLDGNKKTDHKEQYKQMLKSLDSGTRTFNISSKEYRNMRKILSDLINEKNGSEFDKLKALKQNAKLYLENFEKKDNKTPLAIERRNLVKGIYSNINDCLYNVASSSIMPKDKNAQKENTINAFVRYEKQIVQAGLPINDPRVQNFYEKKRNLNIVYSASQKKDIENERTKTQLLGPDRGEGILNETFDKLGKDLDRNIAFYRNVVLNGDRQSSHNPIELKELKEQNNFVINPQQHQRGNVKNIVNEENKDNIFNINNAK